MGASLLLMIMSALALAPLGVILLYRRQAMLADAISHSVLLGIVLAFFITADLSSPFLLIGAALFGLLAVLGMEALRQRAGLGAEAASAVIYPLFFALAILLISLFARNAHLDTDLVLTGEVVYASLEVIPDMPWPIPQASLKLLLAGVFNLLFIVIFYKELKLAAFDPELAELSGLARPSLFYSLMALASFSFVAAFDAIGAILVVSLTITPAAIAALWAASLTAALALATGVAAGMTLLGTVLAFYWNVSISGLSAALLFLFFVLSFLFSRSGFLAKIWQRRKLKQLMREELLILHLGHHSEAENAMDELGQDSIRSHLHWPKALFRRVSRKLIKAGDMTVKEKQGFAYYALSVQASKRYQSLLKQYHIQAASWELASLSCPAKPGQAELASEDQSPVHPGGGPEKPKASP